MRTGGKGGGGKGMGGKGAGSRGPGGRGAGGTSGATKSIVSMKCSRRWRDHSQLATSTPSRPPWKLIPPSQMRTIDAGAARNAGKP